MGGTPFGAPLVGWIAGAAGPRWGMIGGGLACLVSVLAPGALGGTGPRNGGGRRAPARGRTDARRGVNAVEVTDAADPGSPTSAI